MDFVIGFGSTEEQFERDEKANFAEVVREAYEASGACYVSDDAIAAIKQALTERAKAFDAETLEYNTAAQFPDRYSTFNVSVAHNASNVVGIFRFHHVNRRHALSPDGWASLLTTRLFHVDSIDLYRARIDADLSKAEAA